MRAHLRANLALLVLTGGLCCVVYPLALWGVGRVALRDQADGSLVVGADGKPVASRLIAHEVKGDEYYQPRPSETGGSAYNAAASGASNLAANNYLLRDRVARRVAVLVTYGPGSKHGQPVAPDVVAWFRTERPDLVAEWAKNHAGLAQAWVKAEDAARDFVKDWFAQHSADLAEWKRANPGKNHPEPDDLAVPFFESFAREHPATWLKVEDVPDAKEPAKRVVLVRKADADRADIAAVFFDLWRAAHPDVALNDVPADLVTASASGLDPHLTLKAALFQLDRVAGKWAERTGTDLAKVRGDVEALLRAHARAPLFGLAGVELVNVVELNVALHRQYAGKVRAK